LRILEAADALDRGTAHRELYSEPVLIKRPLLRAIDPTRTRPAVLLIDEIDRADEEFEGELLELLAEFQIAIPGLGTVRAVNPPLVVLTSSRTREVHDALKRRCLYQWIDYQTLDKELAIVAARVPQASLRLAE
jgi:MoxR-like ATPase